jgi:hypothetical protein
MESKRLKQTRKPDRSGDRVKSKTMQQGLGLKVLPNQTKDSRDQLMRYGR